MTRVLVTGGAGFLGAHLSRALLERGDTVVCLDSFRTGSRRRARELARESSRFQIFEHDVREPFHVDAKRIYHLACAASPPHYQRDPVHTTLTNVLGTTNALRCAEHAGARLLLASTSEVYGDPERHPQDESYRGNTSSTGPRACYDEGKRCAEALTMDFHRQHGVDVRIARIFNTYGPGMDLDDGRVVSNFVAQALRGEPLTVYGDGAQTRSLCYVSDMVRGLIGLMEQEATTGPVNLGNPAEVTVLDIARAVLARAGTGDIVFRPMPIDDPKRRRPDISLARRTFGFTPVVGLDEGLRATLEDFGRRLSQSA